MPSLVLSHTRGHGDIQQIDSCAVSFIIHGIVLILICILLWVRLGFRCEPLEMTFKFDPDFLHFTFLSPFNQGFLVTVRVLKKIIYLNINQSWKSFQDLTGKCTKVIILAKA